MTSRNNGFGLPAGASIVDRLRKDITSGFFNPGERINEAEVSERYGVSRTPIREAIRQLERDGLVSAQRYRGATVVKLDDAKVAALFETREAVEGMAARLAARHLPQAKSAEILSALNEHRDQLHSDMTIRPPVDLHQVVLKECRNAYLMATMERLRDMLATLRAESVRVVTRRRQSSTEHLAIAVCLYEGDEDAAEAAMRVHIRSVCRNVLNQRLGAEGRDG